MFSPWILLAKTIILYIFLCNYKYFPMNCYNFYNHESLLPLKNFLHRVPVKKTFLSVRWHIVQGKYRITEVLGLKGEVDWPVAQVYLVYGAILLQGCRKDVVIHPQWCMLSSIEQWNSDALIISSIIRNQFITHIFATSALVIISWLNSQLILQTLMILFFIRVLKMVILPNTCGILVRINIGLVIGIGCYVNFNIGYQLLVHHYSEVYVMFHCQLHYYTTVWTNNCRKDLLQST